MFFGCRSQASEMSSNVFKEAQSVADLRFESRIDSEVHASPPSPHP